MSDNVWFKYKYFDTAILIPIYYVMELKVYNCYRK